MIRNPTRIRVRALAWLLSGRTCPSHRTDTQPTPSSPCLLQERHRRRAESRRRGSTCGRRWLSSCTRPRAHRLPRLRVHEPVERGPVEPVGGRPSIDPGRLPPRRHRPYHFEMPELPPGEAGSLPLYEGLELRNRVGSLVSPLSVRLDIMR